MVAIRRNKRTSGNKGGNNRVSEKGKVIKKQAKQRGSQQAVRLVKSAGDETRVKMGSAKSTATIAYDNLNSIENEALVEMNEHLISNPGKILILVRMMWNENNFRKRPTLPCDWLHPTLIYFKNVSKRLWMFMLLRFGKARGKTWTEERLKLMDKKYELQGLEMAVCRLGHMDFNDHLPKAMHYKPLLQKVMVQYWLDGKVDIEISAEGTLTMPAPVYMLHGQVDGFYKQVKHCSGAVCNIFEDISVAVGSFWSIEDAWSWSSCVLKGKKEYNIFQMFKEQNATENIDYDTDSFLTFTTGKVLADSPSMAELFHAAEVDLETFLETESRHAESSTPKKPQGSAKPAI